MIEPSENFTAEQIRLLQGKSYKFIEYLNTKIVAAASEGDKCIYIKTENEILSYSETHDIIMALKKHFQTRGFDLTIECQSGFTISWGEGK